MRATCDRDVTTTEVAYLWQWKSHRVYPPNPQHKHTGMTPPHYPAHPHSMAAWSDPVRNSWSILHCHRVLYCSPRHQILKNVEHKQCLDLNSTKVAFPLNNNFQTMSSQLSSWDENRHINVTVCLEHETRSYANYHNQLYSGQKLATYWYNAIQPLCVSQIHQQSKVCT